MNLSEALAVAAELQDLAEVAQSMQTGNDRWGLLQKWLRQNPEWKARVNKWVKFNPDAAYHHLQIYVCERADIDPRMVKMFISAEMEAKAKTMIAIIQECYRERAGMKTKPAAIVGSVENPTE